MLKSILFIIYLVLSVSYSFAQDTPNANTKPVEVETTAPQKTDFQNVKEYAVAKEAWVRKNEANEVGSTENTFDESVPTVALDPIVEDLGINPSDKHDESATPVVTPE